MVMSTALIIHSSRLKNPPVMRKNKATRSLPWLDNGLAYESAVIWRIPEDLRRHEKQAAGDYTTLTQTEQDGSVLLWDHGIARKQSSFMQNSWGKKILHKITHKAGPDLRWSTTKVLLKHITLLWFSELQCVCSWLKSHKIWTKCFPHALLCRSSPVSIFSLFC